MTRAGKAFEDPRFPLRLLAEAGRSNAALHEQTTDAPLAEIRTPLRWHHHLTIPIYVMLSLANSVVLLNLALYAVGAGSSQTTLLAMLWLAIAGLFMYFRDLETAPRPDITLLPVIVVPIAALAVSLIPNAGLFGAAIAALATPLGFLVALYDRREMDGW